MVAAVKLNDKQVIVLRWVAEGCPEGVMPDDSHRISAAALRTRGLVTTSGRGARWRARLTPAGAGHLAALATGGLSEADEGFPAASGSGPAANGSAREGNGSAREGDGSGREAPAKGRRYHHVAKDF